MATPAPAKMSARQHVNPLEKRSRWKIAIECEYASEKGDHCARSVRHSSLQRVHQSAIALVAFVILDAPSVFDNRFNFGDREDAAILHQPRSPRLVVNIN